MMKPIVVALGLLMFSSSMALASLRCESGEAAKQYHLSATTSVTALPAIPSLGLEGGDGTLSEWVVQQAGPDGYRSFSISADSLDNGLDSQGIEAELMAADLEAGTASFMACSEQGFLVLAVYVDDDLSLSGLLADVLSSTYAINYANVTLHGDQRIGVGFNTRGAQGVLEIIAAQLELPVDGLERRVAELVLTENASAVFDFSESQAPIFNFDDDSCVVRDQFIVHSQWPNGCIGHANSAVTAIDALVDGRLAKRMTSDRSFATFADEIYLVTIGEGAGARRIAMASIALSERD